MKLNIKKIKYSKNKVDKEIDVTGIRNIAITGLNGVGKSVFLKNLKNLNKFSFTMNESFISEEKIGDISVIDDGNIILGDLSALRGNKEFFYKNGNWLCFEDGKNELHISYNEFISRIKENRIFTSINEIIDSSTNNNFKPLNARMIDLFNKMSSITTSQIINTNGKFDESEILKYGYVRAKKALESFLNGKTIYGIKDGKLTIRDLDGELKPFETCLSSGEIILFSIANNLLESNISGTPIILWDEPETNLNPSWQRKIIGFINMLAPDSLLIFVSHSTHILMPIMGMDDTLMMELKRDSSGVEVKKTSIFDNKDLFEEHGLSNKMLANIIEENKKVVFFEGETDKLLFSVFSEEFSSKNIELMSANSAGEVKRNLELMIMHNKGKSVGVFDSDVPQISRNQKLNTDNTLALELVGIGEMQSLESLFISEIESFKDFPFTIITKSNVDKFLTKIILKKGEDKDKMINSCLEKQGFIDSNKFSLTEGTLPSKVNVSEELFNRYKDMVKTKLRPTLVKILTYMSES